ncbi:MAG: hypothetical protein US57_C0003G0019 [Candidatus Moranbacteria bacterium GW2011_GWC2_37_73]|nr:MAG: hypothetical protein UR95_C0003G0040 [Parcubacteria group bacterium GW2011_GWC1_36_108]KKQ01257.1 MAG: hypothetical protein US09_C0001G0017 [Candidatus Moranbacteria bacterium GW2011_GWD1_36_198]KKQ02316.1 MAG: hypothetical protein US10_C0003G0017 [Candidatus Moranbacteria bacterium GW2011_GWD2_36_198]KKQ40211.1 MAG: hypothetical protein US57_C0003G0019 [Candidatus Moranbacteria bacterium GW2011_GWC2_37_73]
MMLKIKNKLIVCHPELVSGSSLALQSDSVLDSRFHGNDNVKIFL